MEPSDYFQRGILVELLLADLPPTYSIFCIYFWNSNHHRQIECRGMKVSANLQGRDFTVSFCLFVE